MIFLSKKKKHQIVTDLGTVTVLMMLSEDIPGEDKKASVNAILNVLNLIHGKLGPHKLSELYIHGVSTCLENMEKSEKKVDLP